MNTCLVCKGWFTDCFENHEMCVACRHDMKVRNASDPRGKGPWMNHVHAHYIDALAGIERRGMLSAVGKDMRR